MRIISFEPHHFANLHQSICKFLEIDPFESKKICYSLYVANQDTYYAMRGRRPYQQAYFGEFLNVLDHAPYRPYRTVVQLYRSLETVIDSIRCCYLIEQDRKALRRLDEMMASMEMQFLGSYGFEITSPETTYSLCVPHLTPGTSEPQECLKSELDLATMPPDSTVHKRTCRCLRSRRNKTSPDNELDHETNDEIPK